MLALCMMEEQTHIPLIVKEGSMAAKSHNENNVAALIQVSEAALITAIKRLLHYLLW